jgi:peroxiredoxin Q/BCP
MMQAGSPAPAFSLPDQDGKTVSLADLKGRWVVLYFYPRDDTPGCTIEACEFTAKARAFAKLGARVYGCSADGAAAHQKFIAKYDLGVGLLTDVDRAVMTKYGAWGKKVMYGKHVEGVIRSTVVIDPAGRVAHHWAKVKAAGHAEAVLGRLAELQGGAAPAAKTAAREPAAKAAKGAKGAKAKKKG